MKFTYERKLWNKGIKLVAGVDEVGRGPLAGPVVAAAVILPHQAGISGLADSKQLNPNKREEFFYKIKKQALGIGIGSINHKVIDRIGIGEANLLAMKIAVKKLGFFPDHLLIDGKRNRIDLPVQQKGISSGDRKCASIAAASIIAKVTRDRIMLRYHKKYPQYRFDRHKGYGTREHIVKLRKFGPCPIHRKSFSPVKA